MRSPEHASRKRYKSSQYKITLTADATHSNAVKSEDPDASKQKITKTVTFDIVWE
jgi:hypothetical protein